MKLTFVIPDPKTFNSGGNLYNLKLMDALEDLGVNCMLKKPELLPDTLLEFSGFSTLKDDILLWDTLFLDRLDYVNPLQKNWLIVHHLESLFPQLGFSSEDWFRKHERPLLERFDAFLVSSSYTREYLISNGIEAESIFVITPALGFVPEIREKKFNKVNALMVANLQERKGILPFLEVLQYLEKLPDFSLSIAGNMELEPEYATACLELVQSTPELKMRIQFLGERPPGEIVELYKDSNLYISTAFMETYGMSLQEAAAMGLPLLVLKGGNAGNHVVEGNNGVVAGNMDELIQQLILLSTDKSELESLGREAMNLAKGNHYTWRQAAEKLLGYLK